MSTENNAGKVVIISATDSFLAKSLITKLDDVGIEAVFSHSDIKEIETLKDMELVILFLSDELAENPENIIFIKDMVQENDIGLLMIGDDPQYEAMLGCIPERLVTDHIQRPLDIEKLIKRVEKYLNDNTGEKRKKNVLIVDDDITYMRLVYEWLREYYHVGMASNGVQAIAYLSKNPVDLVLLDYEMPIANGPQVLSMLKNDTETGEVPVMFLTGHGDKESVLSVIDLKPADYLLKTIDKNTLLQKLDAFFKASR